MMNWVMFPNPLLYSRFFSERWNQLEMDLENIYGLVNKALMESGGDSTKISYEKSEPNTLTKYISEPNTITILTMTRQPQSNETSSNTTTPNISQIKTEDGSSKER